MREIIFVVIALTLGVLAPGMPEPGRAKAQERDANIKSGEALAGARYFGLDQPREWIYEVRFDTPRAPNHFVESWLAEGVGLIKYRVSEKGAHVYTVTLKSVRKIE